MRRCCIEPRAVSSSAQELRIDRLSRVDYVEVLVRIYCALTVGEPFDESDTRRTAEEAWETDSVGNSMERVGFMDAIFELVDVLTLGITPDE